jgi:hypothetical protein
MSQAFGPVDVGVAEERDHVEPPDAGIGLDEARIVRHGLQRDGVVALDVQHVGTGPVVRERARGRARHLDQVQIRNRLELPHHRCAGRGVKRVATRDAGAGPEADQDLVRDLTDRGGEGERGAGQRDAQQGERHRAHDHACSRSPITTSDHVRCHRMSADGGVGAHLVLLSLLHLSALCRLRSIWVGRSTARLLTFVFIALFSSWSLLPRAFSRALCH